MPTYRYRCGGCGEEFEVWQSITDDPIRTHDHGCGGELVKVLTPAGIVLKGSGFYRNDSRSGATRGGGSSSGDGKDGAGDKGGGDKGGDKKDKGDKAAASKDGGGSPSSSGGEGTSSSTAGSTTS